MPRTGRKNGDAPVEKAVPRTLDAIDAELERCALERASLIDSKNALPAAEHRLVERDASAVEFGELDRRRRRIIYQLEEVERREVELLLAVPEAQRSARHREWLSFVDRFADVASRAGRAAEVLAAVQTELHKLHVEAARCGFNPFQSVQAAIPTVSDVRVPWAAFTTLVDRVPSLRRAMSEPITMVERWPVRFSKFCVVVVGIHQVGFNSGETAGFVPDLAWHLVDTERAVWADSRRVPPRSPAKRKRAR